MYMYNKSLVVAARRVGGPKQKPPKYECVTEKKMAGVKYSMAHRFRLDATSTVKLFHNLFAAPPCTPPL
jgi:hypothetical protein